MYEVHKLLNYWYNLEFFSPFWPTVTKDTIYINDRKKQLVWLTNPHPNYTYDVYLGEINSQDFIIEMLEAVDQKDDNLEKDTSKSCICALKIAPDGTYIQDSFSISNFVWSIAKIIAEKNMRVYFNTIEIDKLNNEVNDILVAMGKKIEYTDLEKIYLIVNEKIRLNSSANKFSAVINKKYENKKRETKDQKEPIQENQQDDFNVNTDMLSSFYVSDIDMVKQNVQAGDKIIQYIEALKKPATNRIEIDTDIYEMKKWLSPDKYPLGKWPSIHSPSLMQQIAINIGISDNEDLGNIFSVNGPPGTGKTTLLKEIIASNVVQRAMLLSEYEIPDNAFIQHEFDSPENEFLKYYYQPYSKLIKYGIIVASNNNAAVENISKELPIAKDVKNSNSGLFNLDEHKEIYFSEIANVLMGNNQECWGLISARLGKKSNLNELKQALWFNREGTNLQQLYKEEIPDWEQAKNAFKNKYAEVLKYRKQIELAMEKTIRHRNVAQEYEFAKGEVSNANNKMIGQQTLLNDSEKKLDVIKQKIEVLKENILLLKSRVPFLKRLLPFLFKKDPILLQLNQMNQELDSATIKLTDNNLHIGQMQIELNKLTAICTSAQEVFNEKEKIFLNSLEQINQYKNQFGKNFADEDFWTNIQDNEDSQLASPWTDKNYDTLREELFYYGLMLHKSFILNSKSVKQNISDLVNMWSGSFSEKDKAASYTHLLNTLSLVVPVVSTTFASVSTFLKYIDKNGLGTLIIDEAGQATPYSALGALWRTNKAIIVGDPLQVEPVLTVPKELSKKFAEEFEIEAAYRPYELSVQVLADSINRYGGYREYSNGKLWLGCPLVVHRRCLDPMFSISNNIAYNNRMFKQSLEPKADLLLLFDKSVWININGRENGEKDHFVSAQGDKVIELVLNSFALQNDFPNIYIISPFKTVITNLKNLLKNRLYENYPNYYREDIDNWIEKSCGTVHTFQGKEANEVIFVLGCDEKSGIGAAQWAGRKPNILNVAVTRAKYRIAIIGDSNLWRKVPNFDFAYKILNNE